MNRVFEDMLGINMVVYLDNILIFSKMQEQHNWHVRQVLEQLRTNRLFGKLEKCVFDQPSVEFLGYVVSDGRIGMAWSKVDAVLAWELLHDQWGLQQFLSLATFYCPFVAGWLGIDALLTALTSKKVPFVWSREAQDMFDGLKHFFTATLVLAHLNFKCPFIVETDTSDYQNLEHCSKVHHLNVWQRCWAPFLS